MNFLLSSQPHLTLTLISHSHTPPLLPAPSLKFDVRNLPNPPKHIRDAYNGTSKRLQEWLLAEERFVEKRDEVRGSILHAMDQRSASEKDGEGLDRNDGNERTNDLNQEVLDDMEELRVGLFCAMGRHRSVALVEVLAKMAWPEGWEFIVEHRDLGRKRGENKRGRGNGKGKGSRGLRGGEMSTSFVDDLEEG